MLHLVGRHNFQWKLRSKQKYHVQKSYIIEKGVSTFFQGKPSDMKVYTSLKGHFLPFAQLFQSRTKTEDLSNDRFFLLKIQTTEAH